MSKLSIQDWIGTKRTVDFVGYNRSHTACLIRNEQGERRVITLQLPKRFHLHFRENPIGKKNSPALEINRVALHLPACFASLEEKNAYSNPNSEETKTALLMEHDCWKLITRHKHWLEPSHDKKLFRMLRWELNKLRRQFTIRVKKTDYQIADISNKITALSSAASVDAKQKMEQLQQQIISLKNEFSIITGTENGGFKHISIFDTTLEMVRQGWRGLREKLLEREWAKHYHLDLKTIPVEVAAFHAWIENCAFNARQRVFSLNVKTVEFGTCLNLYPSQWEILEASIMYKICFADGTGCWLDNIEELAVTDPQEIEEFDQFEADVLRARKEQHFRQESDIETKREKNIAAEAELEADRRRNFEDEARRRREQAKQPVKRQEVREALNVKTERAVRKICERHNVDWPQNRGQLDMLLAKHLRHKKYIGEATAKRNRQRAEKRRNGPHETQTNIL